MIDGIKRDSLDNINQKKGNGGKCNHTNKYLISLFYCLLIWFFFSFFCMILK